LKLSAFFVVEFQTRIVLVVCVIAVFEDHGLNEMTMGA